MKSINLHRRQFLNHSMALAGSFYSSTFLSRLAEAQVSAAAKTNHMVFIFLRGGADALSILSPTAAIYPQLTTLRPKTHLNATSSLKPYPNLLVHKALNPLFLDKEIASRLNFITQVGSLNDTRSHFSQMDHIETGSATSIRPTGIFARLSDADPYARETFGINSTMAKSLIGTKKKNPIILRDPIQLHPSYMLNSLKTGMSKEHRLGLYTQGNDPVVKKFATAALSQYTSATPVLGNVTISSLMAGKGYINSNFGQYLAVAAATLGSNASTQGVNPSVIAIDGDHSWDTHADQDNYGTSASAFGQKLTDLSTNLAAFKRDLAARGKWANTVIVVMTEFGRTIKENANAGTDHGRGGLMMLLGGSVKSFAEYTGPKSYSLPSATTLNSSSALDVRHNYQVVLAEIMERHLGIPQTTVCNSIFCGEVNPSQYLKVLR